MIFCSENWKMNWFLWNLIIAFLLLFIDDANSILKLTLKFIN